MMNLATSLRLTTTGKNRIAFVGAGGKSTAMFQLAQELAPSLVTTSTHLGAWQAGLADRHFVWAEGGPLPDLEAWLGSGVTLITGSREAEGDRLLGLSPTQLAAIEALAGYHDLPLLVEADGSRLRPLKAPAAHEPAIPAWADLVVVVAGLSGLGKPLQPEWVHRAELFSSLSGLAMGDPVTPGAIASVLTHLQGGLRQIPARAQRSVLLTQADTLELQAAGQQIARQCLVEYRSVVLASLAQGDGSQPRSGAGFQPSLEIYAIYEPTAGILLAAGGATRLGRPKQLLTWQDETFVHRAARTALEAGLSPLVVVTGAWGDEVAIAVSDLPVQVANNPEWETGQGSSVRAGILALPATCGAAVFLLSDQPQIPSTLIEALLAEHARTLGAVVAPLIDGRRGNPVCFDRSTFQDLAALSGDTGGRALFSRFPVTWLPWQDASALLDVDTEEDYRRLTGDHSVP